MARKATSKQPVCTLEEFLGKTPPVALDAEMCVLGSILIDPGQLDTATSVIHGRDFFDEANRVIFETMQAIQAAGNRVDVTLLVEELRRRELFEACGGAAYVAKVARSVPHAGHCRSYADIVKRKSAHRQVMQAGMDILTLAADESIDTGRLMSGLNSLTMRALEGSQAVDVKAIGDRAVAIGQEITEGRYGRVRGIQTRFGEFNRRTSGFTPGLWVVGARPSNGKSALLLNWGIDEARTFDQEADAAGDRQKMVGIFSLEMDADEIAERSIADLSGVPIAEWENLSSDGLESVSEAVRRLISTRMLIDDRVDIGVAEICAQARIWSRQHDLSFILIDYLQLIRMDDSPGTSRQQQIGKVTRALKNLSKELQIPVIVACQLNREAEGEKPKLSHLREAGDIEQDANVVLFLWSEEGTQSDNRGGGPRHEFSRNQAPPPEPASQSDLPQGCHRVMLTIAKQRRGVRNFDIPMILHGPRFRFVEEAPPWQQAEAEAQAARANEYDEVFGSFNNGENGVARNSPEDNF